MPDTNSTNDMDAYLRMLQGESGLDQQNKDREQKDHLARIQMERERVKPSPFDKAGEYAARLSALGWIEAGRFKFVDQDFDSDLRLFRLPGNIAWAEFMEAEHRPQCGLVLEAGHDLALQIYDNGAERSLYAKLVPTNKAYQVQEFSIAFAGKHYLLRDDPREARLAIVREIIAHMVPIQPGQVQPANGAAIRVAQQYAMCKHPVTQRWYEAVIGRNPRQFTGDPLQPVEEVSWHDAQAFCRQMNDLCAEAGLQQGNRFVLPTEAQWEYACRAGSTGDFGLLSNGLEGTVNQMAWYSENSGLTAHAAGRKEPNAWGIYDMHGNVLEWCEDRYDASGALRVTRGGFWGIFADTCTAGFRSWADPVNRSVCIGFRVASVPA